MPAIRQRLTPSCFFSAPLAHAEPHNLEVEISYRSTFLHLTLAGGSRARQHSAPAGVRAYALPLHFAAEHASTAALAARVGKVFCGDKANTMQGTERGLGYKQNAHGKAGEVVPAFSPCAEFDVKSSRCASPCGSSASTAHSDGYNVYDCSPVSTQRQLPLMGFARADEPIETAVQEGLAEEPITTLMICNIPCRCDQEHIASIIDGWGFQGTYDFLHLPARSAMKNGNLGYGFVNFTTPEAAVRFTDTISGSRAFSQVGQGGFSQKVLIVKAARVQGLAANTYQFGGSMRKSRRPDGALVNTAHARGAFADSLNGYGLRDISNHGCARMRPRRTMAR